MTVKLADIQGVEVFKAGDYYGRVYTEADVKQLVDDTNKLIDAGTHRAPVKLGHDDAQEVAREAGLPALGWIKRLYQNGTTILADLRDVPEAVVDMIRNKLYDSVSSEIYLEKTSEAEFGVKGLVFRALALLGGDVPKVKGLKALSASLAEDLKDKVVAIALDDSGRNPKEGEEGQSVGQLKPGLEGPKPTEKGGINMPEAQEALRLAEEETKKALALAATEKAARIKLENDQKAHEVAEFIEAHKEYIVPALQPKFKALCDAAAASVKFGDAEKPYLSGLLEFTKDLINSKVVVLEEIAEDGKEEKGEGKKRKVELAEAPFQVHVKASRTPMELRNADLSVKAEKYAKKHEVSFTEALKQVAKIAAEEA